MQSDDVTMLNARTVVLAAICGSTLGKLRAKGIFTAEEADEVFQQIELMVPADIMAHCQQLMRAAQAAAAN